MRVIVRIDPRLSQMARGSEALAQRARPMMQAGLEKEGRAIRGEMVAAETAQTHLKRATIHRALQTFSGPLTFTIKSSGGNVRLKHFGARESGGGVIAAPWGQPTYYAGAFIKSGRPGSRSASPKLNGHVFERVGKARKPIRQVRSGLYIPDEMTSGATLKAFDAGAVRAGGQILERLARALP